MLVEEGQTGLMNVRPFFVCSSINNKELDITLIVIVILYPGANQSI